MSRTETVVCDGCRRDITYTNNDIDYRISVAAERIPVEPAPDGGAVFVTAAYVRNPLPQAKHFCNLSCLDAWRRQSG